MPVGPEPRLHAQAARSGDIVIPFTIGPQNCTNQSRWYNVSMRIHNVLAQPVSIPTLASHAASPPPGTTEPPITNLRLRCGRYLARWNGIHMTTGRRLPPGTYLTELVIDGLRITRKITLGR